MISVCFFENKKIFSNWFIYVFLESYALNGNRVNELYMIVRDQENWVLSKRYLWNLFWGKIN